MKVGPKPVIKKMWFFYMVWKSQVNVYLSDASKQLPASVPGERI